MPAVPQASCQAWPKAFIPGVAEASSPGVTEASSSGVAEASWQPWPELINARGIGSGRAQARARGITDNAVNWFFAWG